MLLNSSLIGLANASGESLAVPAFLLVPTLLLAAGALQCIKKARVPGANAVSFYAMAVPMALWSLFLGLAFIQNVTGTQSPAWLGVLLLLVLISGFVASIVLGIVGLVQIGYDADRYSKGRAHAGMGIGFSSLSLLILAGVTIAVFIHADRRSPAPALAATLPVPEVGGRATSIDNEAMNYRYEMPGRPWTTMNPAQINPDASFVMMQARPTVFFMIIAEDIGVDEGVTTDMLVEIVKAGLRSMTPNPQFSQPTPRTVNGMDGISLQAGTTLQNTPLHYRYWLAYHNGYAYQLVVWSEARYASAVDQAYPDLIARFHQLDSSRVSTGGMRPVDHIASDIFGYHLPLDNERWMAWDELGMDMPDADTGALLGTFGAMAAVPIMLGDQNPSDRILAETMLPYMDFTYRGDDIMDITPITHGDATGLVIAARRTVDGLAYLYHIRILQDKGLGLMLAGWVPVSLESQLDTIQRAMDQLVISGPAENAMQRMSGAQREAQAIYINDIGLSLFAQARYRDAMPYFTKAAQWDPTVDTYPYNVADTHYYMGQPEQAVQWLQEQVQLHPGSHRLKANLAFNLGQIAELEQSAELYAPLFAADFENAFYYEDYIDTLIRLDRGDEAMHDIEARLEERPARSLQLLKADVHTALGQHVQAVDWLKGISTGRRFDEDVAYRLADNKIEAGHSLKALDICEQLVRNGHDTAYTWFLRGCAYLDLEQLHEAKNAFETALARSPGDPTARSYLDLVLSLMEQENIPVDD